MKIIVLLLLINISVNSIYAQIKEVQSIDSLQSKLDEVTVIAQKTSEINLRIPYSVNVLTKRSIELQQNRTTPEALMQVGGVFVQKTNHGGGSPIIRGFMGNQILTMIDGIRLNNAIYRYGPNQYLNTVDPYIIRKIEIAKGTGSVQYGSDAIGGVLNIITKDPDFISKSTISSQLISKYTSGNMEKTIRSETTIGSKKAAFIIGGSVKSFGDLIGGDTTKKQLPTGYEEYSFDTKAKFLLKDNIQISFVHQQLKQLHIPNFIKLKLENFEQNETELQQRMLTYAKLQVTNNNKLIKEFNITIAHQQNDEQRKSRKKNTTILNEENDKINTFSITSEIVSQIKKAWQTNSGIELYTDHIKSNAEVNNLTTNAITKKRGLYPNNATTSNLSIYTLHQIRKNNWTFNGGIRYNIFNLNIVDTVYGNFITKPSALVANAAVLYNFKPNKSIYFSYNNSYRAPNVDDFGTLGIVDFRYEIPEKNLLPEKSKQIELGVKAQSNKLFATASVYYNNVHNIINRVKLGNDTINGYPVYKKENIEKAIVRGFETALQYKLTKYLHISNNITYTFGTNITNNEPLRRTPPLFTRTALTFTKLKWTTSAEFLTAAKQTRLAKGDIADNRIPLGGTPGWSVINFYTNYTTKNLDINVNLQNCTNIDYRTHGSGINGIGRSISISLKLKIDKNGN